MSASSSQWQLQFDAKSGTGTVKAMSTADDADKTTAAEFGEKLEQGLKAMRHTTLKSFQQSAEVVVGVWNAAQTTGSVKLRTVELVDGNSGTVGFEVKKKSVGNSAND